MICRFAIFAVFVLAVCTPAAAADEDQAMARCQIEFMEHEDALHARADEFYETCMKAQGFNKSRYPLTCFSAKMAHCYEKASESNAK
jgi:hypothetical protein